MLLKSSRPKLSRASGAKIEQDVFVSIMRAADALARSADALLKTAGLSGTQYNVLRILKGAGENGLACSEIGGRLISRDPDMTRLLDRMESRGWIARTREQNDRRVVKTRITASGQRILDELESPVQELHRRQFRHVPRKQLRQLLLLLERARTEPESSAE